MRLRQLPRHLVDVHVVLSNASIPTSATSNVLVEQLEQTVDNRLLHPRIRSRGVKCLVDEALNPPPLLSLFPQANELGMQPRIMTNHSTSASVLQWLVESKPTGSAPDDPLDATHARPRASKRLDS